LPEQFIAFDRSLGTAPCMHWRETP